MAQQNLILTVIGDDRPGLVERLSAAISAYGGNWEQASMSRLAGKFAGIVQISVAGDKAGALGQALDELEGLDITQTTAGQAPVAAGQRLTLSLVGHDRIGIVQEVSQVLAEQGVNVEQLNTYTASAPMSAEPLFHAEAELLARPDLDLTHLIDALELLSNDLMVEISLNQTLQSPRA